MLRIAGRLAITRHGFTPQNIICDQGLCKEFVVNMERSRAFRYAHMCVGGLVRISVYLSSFECLSICLLARLSTGLSECLFACLYALP